MGIVIVAPHPDDEWIGCGCTILKKLDDKEEIKVLIVTNTPKNKQRTLASMALAKEYGYDLKILGEAEKKIDENKLKEFLVSEIEESDVVYIPDSDSHPDHSVINKISKSAISNKMIEYAVYNNSKNPLIRVKNKILSLIYGKGFPSFMQGSEDTKFKHKLEIKNKNIAKFSEMPRDADVFREI